MSRAQAVIADAVAAVIAAAIDEDRAAPSLVQARRAVRALARDGWHVSPIPPTVCLSKTTRDRT